jgi:hypothetical protein
MRFSIVRGTIFLFAAWLCAQSQDPPAKETSGKETQGMPPRAAPTEYLSHIQVGSVTLAAEFTGHSVAPPEGTYEHEDFVVVEAAFFGPPDTRLKLSYQDFSLRINGKKEPTASQPPEFVLKGLKDPQWEPPAQKEKSKTSFGTGGGQNDSSAAPVHMPMELLRPIQQRVQKACFPEGERALPQAGLLFFTYRGKAQNIKTLELIYSGPAGKTTLPLQP